MSMELELTYTFPLFVIAWFLQMGLHEGGHAYAAYYLGDDTSSLLGKRSIHPFDHVEWNNMGSILMSVILPVVTAAVTASGIPLGMASVPVNPMRLKNRSRDMALISFAGPFGNLVLMVICWGLHEFMMFLPYTNMAASPDASLDVGALLWLFDELCLCVYLTSALYAVFNLVPIPPLDGSSILRHFLPRSGQDLLDSIRPYGFTILMVLFWVGDAGKYLYVPLRFLLDFWSLRPLSI